MNYAIIGAACLVVSVIAFLLGGTNRKRVAEKKIGSAEDQAKKILNDALKNAENAKKEALMEAKDEVFKLKSDADRDIKERRAEIIRQERYLQHKEEILDKKTETLDKKEEVLQEKINQAEAKLSEAETIKKSQFDMLEKISGLSVEQAKEYLLKNVDENLTHEKAVKIAQNEQAIKEDCEIKARNIIALAIQRCASDQVAEMTVSVVPLPNDEMKGRIIGREGRNIRTLETLTGVDLIIDDTPEAITLSSHDPVKREIARLSLERLINDGRIHPARIEETVEKTRKEVENIIKESGEKAVLEVGITNMHPDLVKLLGRMRYRTSYGQNVLIHSIEVSYISGMLASEIGCDVTLAKRAGLLHDIGKAMTHEIEGSHVAIGVDIAKKYREPYDVIHAIESHHGDVEAKTAIACIVAAADAISAARPGARRENVESYVKRLEKLEEIATSFEGVDSCYAVQAGREVRVMLKPDVIDDEKMIIVAHDIAQKIESEMEYPGQIKINVIRETRAVDYAK